MCCYGVDCDILFQRTRHTRERVAVGVSAERPAEHVEKGRGVGLGGARKGKCRGPAPASGSQELSLKTTLFMRALRMRRILITL